MVSVSEATSIILAHALRPAQQTQAVADAVGRVLAEPIQADRDFPPFDRVSMDGIAIHFEAFRQGLRSFAIEGVQAAGQAPLTLQTKKGAIEVMTGAMLPQQTNCVIRYEDIALEQGRALVKVEEVVERQNIHTQGQDAQRGETLLEPGTLLSPAEVALLASVGRSQVAVRQMPPVAIVSTGDELVGIEEQPLPWQIRRSNSYALQAAFRSMGVTADVYHLPDEPTQLAQALSKQMASHGVVVLSGGVSKGKFDYVPAVLAELGIEKHFHQVNQKPGKPFWFGTGPQNTVFALPGNPVSTFLCFYRYVLPWWRRSLGLPLISSQAILAEDFQFRPSVAYFLQVHTENQRGRLLAYPRAGGGSGDFANLKEVDGFLELPAGASHFKAGDSFDYYSFRAQ